MLTRSGVQLGFYPNEIRGGSQSQLTAVISESLLLPEISVPIGYRVGEEGFLISYIYYSIIIIKALRIGQADTHGSLAHAEKQAISQRKSQKNGRSLSRPE